ncbi:hypothetical protein J4D99_20985 [Siccationidurans ginsengisoli]|nr:MULTISPECIES: hypothetical protein [unclassified Hymenobacter]MBO2033881.1 hypothetical protein [Hymenobacter sp. BT559]
MSSDRMYGLVEGYRLAANVLINEVMETGQNQDILVWPIVFMYRQHIELRLKELITVGNALLGEGKEPWGHRLNELWPVARLVVRKMRNELEEDPGEFALVDHFIAELSSVDPDATAFRYPVDTKGIKRLANVDHINLRHLKECMDSFCNFLENIAWWFAAAQDARPSLND